MTINSAKEAKKIIANHLEAMESLKHKSTTVIRCKCQECNFYQGYLQGMKDPTVLALVEELESIHAYKELSNSGIKALAAYREAVK